MKTQGFAGRASSLTIFLMFILVPGRSISQPYARAAFGYNLSVESELLGNNYTYNTQMSPTTTYQSVTGTYGNGFNFSGAIGDGLSSNIGVELGVDYVIGTSYSFTNITNNSGGRSSSYTTTTNGGYFALDPAVLFTLGVRADSVRPFIRLGPDLAFPRLSMDLSGSTEGTYVYSGSATIGYSAAVGVTTVSGPNLAWVIELSSMSLTWPVNSEEYTSVKGYTETHTYADSYTSANTNTSLTETFPYSTIGASIGITYTLNK